MTDYVVRLVDLWTLEAIVDIEEIDEKVEKLLELVGKDLTHRILSEWLNKSSDVARKKFGDALLEMIPRVAHETVHSKLRAWAEALADEFLRVLRPKIEAQVRAELDKQADAIAAVVVERVKQRAPVVAEQYVTDIVREKFRRT